MSTAHETTAADLLNRALRQSPGLVLVLVLLACNNADRNESPAISLSGFRSCGYFPDLAGTISVGALGADRAELWFAALDDVTLTGDGRIIAADGQRGLLHLLDQRGRLIWTRGGLGAGPGEFRNIVWVDAWPDTIVAFDSRQRRFTLFGSDGDLLSTIRVDEGLPVGRMKDGVFAFRISTVQTAMRKGGYTDSFRIRLNHIDGSVLDSLGPFSGFDRYVDHTLGFSVWLAPFGRRATYQARGEIVLVADGATPSIVVRPGEGHPRVVQVPDRSRGVSDEDASLYRQREVAASRMPEASQAMLREMTFPTVTPRYGWEVMDAGSAVLVARSHRPDGTPELLITPSRCMAD
ncbi:MAG TPA: hypothetical protein VMM79_14090 [Longimicrobiales bacterium]|nr:hypothetical protein [Longimicrobiales bacterium]